MKHWYWSCCMLSVVHGARRQFQQSVLPEGEHSIGIPSAHHLYVCFQIRCIILRILAHPTFCKPIRKELIRWVVKPSSISSSSCGGAAAAPAASSSLMVGAGRGCAICRRWTCALRLRRSRRILARVLCAARGRVCGASGAAGSLAHQRAFRYEATRDLIVTWS